MIPVGLFGVSPTTSPNAYVPPVIGNFNPIDAGGEALLYGAGDIETWNPDRNYYNTIWEATLGYVVGKSVLADIDKDSDLDMVVAK